MCPICKRWMRLGADLCDYGYALGVDLTPLLLRVVFADAMHRRSGSHSAMTH